MKKPHKKVAIVTGASRGIGRAITIKLTKLGCNIIGVYEKRDDKSQDLEKKYPNVKMIKADIGKSSNCKKIIDFAVKKFGGIDILINNAGIFLGGDIVDFSLKDWNRILNVNLTSNFLFCKFAIPYLEKSGNGVIVNISSRFGIDEYTLPWCNAYGVTNAGINNLTVGLSKELEPKGIRVNAVIPTVTDTDRFRNAFTKEEQEEIINKGKLGTSDEVAAIVLNLIKDKKKNGEIVIDKRVLIESDV